MTMSRVRANNMAAKDPPCANRYHFRKEMYWKRKKSTASKGDLYYTKTEIEQFKEDKQGEQLEDRKQKAKSEKEKYEEDKAEHEREVSRMAKKLEDESRKKQEAWEKQAEVERMEKMMRDQLSAMYSLSLSNK